MYFGVFHLPEFRGRACRTRTKFIPHLWYIGIIVNDMKSSFSIIVNDSLCSFHKSSRPYVPNGLMQWLHWAESREMTAHCVVLSWYRCSCWLIKIMTNDCSIVQGKNFQLFNYSVIQRCLIVAFCFCKILSTWYRYSSFSIIVNDSLCFCCLT